jgi:rare lipoprotein A
MSYLAGNIEVSFRSALQLTCLATLLIPACTQVSAPATTYAYPSYPRPSGDPSDNSTAPHAREPIAAQPKQHKPAEAKEHSPLRQDYEQAKTVRTLRGKATYYGDSLTGHKTANGDRYDPDQFTAAHKTLRFGSIVRVTRRDTSQTTYVRINDRGPFGPKDRIIDLSKAAARELEMLRAGVVEVTVEVVFDPTQK